jgi:S-DNA-T family DNA segregation ATPase FtsK/SpoIIIE
VGGGVAIGGGSEDNKYQEAVRLAIESGQVSASFLQRRMGVGFQRAARLIDEMEQNGVIGPKQGSRPREVLIHSLDEIS